MNTNLIYKIQMTQTEAYYMWCPYHVLVPFCKIQKENIMKQKLINKYFASSHGWGSGYLKCGTPNRHLRNSNRFSSHNNLYTVPLNFMVELELDFQLVLHMFQNLCRIRNTPRFRKSIEFSITRIIHCTFTDRQTNLVLFYCQLFIG